MRKKKKDGLVFKIDFVKPYDHVDWCFLDFVSEDKGLWGSLKKVDV